MWINLSFTITQSFGKRQQLATIRLSCTAGIAKFKLDTGLFIMFGLTVSLSSSYK